MLLLSSVLLGLATALPLARASPAALATVTAPAVPTPVRRDIISSAESKFSSATGAAASALPTVLGGWPSLQDIEKKLDVSDDDLANISVSALLIPSYANFSNSSWNVRFYGLVYKLPNVNASDLTDLIDGFKADNLNDTERSLLQNRTQDLSSLPVASANVSVIVRSNGTTETKSSGIQLPSTDAVGEIEQFIQIPALNKEVEKVQVVETGVLNVTGPGNGTIILVPSEGYSIVSDIDDVLRITQVYVPNKGLFNSFVEPYVNVPGIPELFRHWLTNLPGVAFHYDTTTPVQLTRTYVEYLFNNFPLGSLEMRPINISEPSSILDARQQSLVRLFQTFPKRKFVLVGDTSSSTLLSAYPQIAQQFPNQLACIFVRNTSATDSDDKIPYNTKDFQNISSSQYFFYRTSEDLYNLDIANGQCVNSSIPQNVSFGEQGGILGGNAAVRMGGDAPVWALVAAGVAMVAGMFL